MVSAKRAEQEWDWCVWPDPSCSVPLDDHGDPLNLRCWGQKWRFGFDFLQPLGRYTDALTKARLKDEAGNGVQNPIADVGPRRIVVGGIVGVPWQDIASTGSLSDGTRLDLLRGDQLAGEGRWDVVLGDPANGVPATSTGAQPKRSIRAGSAGALAGEFAAVVLARCSPVTNATGTCWSGVSITMTRTCR